MTQEICTATAGQTDLLWPAVGAEHLFRDLDSFRAYREAYPWCVRVTGRGEAALLGRWKHGVDVLAMRGVWAPERDVPEFVADASRQAREHGFGRVLSPLLPVELLGGYSSAGMRPAQRVVAMQGHPELVLPAGPPVGVEIREGTAADIPAVARLDAACFDEFWRWDERDLLGFLADERLAVARARGGALIGYTLATVSRGAATLTRLGVAVHARRAGLGRALVAEAAAWAVRRGGVTLALCTQEDNVASRALYREAGLSEIAERYAFAMLDAREEAGR